MSEVGSLRTSLSKPRPFLGPPRVLAPRKEGHVSATVQFIVPGLALAAGERERLVKLFDRLDAGVQAAAIERVANEATGQTGILASATFYVPAKRPDEAEAAIDTASALVVERFLGVLSFLAGVRCVAINARRPGPEKARPTRRHSSRAAVPGRRRPRSDGPRERSATPRRRPTCSTPSFGYAGGWPPAIPSRRTGP